MKTSSVLSSLLFFCLINVNLNSQEVVNTLYASVSNIHSATCVVGSHPADTIIMAGMNLKNDVVINMSMIESFRRCYNTIEPFSLTDFLAGDAHQLSAKYMAYMRARMYPENIEVALASEMKTVQVSLNQKNQVNGSDLAYTEQPTTQIENSPITEDVKTTPAETKKEGYKSTKKSNGVKWIDINK